MGRAGAIDVTVAHPLDQSHLLEASAAGVSCLEAAEAIKHLENDTKCQDLGWQCLPIAVTPYGNYGPESLVTLKRLAQRYVANQRVPPSSGHKYFFGKLSFALCNWPPHAQFYRAPGLSHRDILSNTNDIAYTAQTMPTFSIQRRLHILINSHTYTHSHTHSHSPPPETTHSHIHIFRLTTGYLIVHSSL